VLRVATAPLRAAPIPAFTRRRSCPAANLPLLGGDRGRGHAAAEDFVYGDIKGIFQPVAPAAAPQKTETDFEIVMVVFQTDAGRCAPNPALDGGFDGDAHHYRQDLGTTRMIKCSRLRRLTTPSDILFEPNTPKKAARQYFFRLAPNGIAQDFAYLLFGAPTALFCTAVGVMSVCRPTLQKPIANPRRILLGAKCTGGAEPGLAGGNTRCLGRFAVKQFGFSFVWQYQQSPEITRTPSWR
jgi:hypothetical protein